jgi:hypothetical protein
LIEPALRPFFVLTVRNDDDVTEDCVWTDFGGGGGGDGGGDDGGDGDSSVTSGARGGRLSVCRITGAGDAIISAMRFWKEVGGDGSFGGDGGDETVADARFWMCVAALNAALAGDAWERNSLVNMPVLASMMTMNDRSTIYNNIWMQLWNSSESSKVVNAIQKVETRLRFTTV